MVETKDRSDPPERLPIKLILPRQGREKPVPAGGSPPKPFREVTDEYRSRLQGQVEAIRAVAEKVAEYFQGLMSARLLVRCTFG